MMYVAIVLLTMLVLPVASIATEHLVHPELAVGWLAGRWFVFWGVGVRLALAGARQYLQPAFTAREIFHLDGGDALILVQELGIANSAAAMLGLLAVAFAGFVVPTAVYGSIFYGIAGVRHAFEPRRSGKETLAMMSDLFIAVVLTAFLLSRL